MCKTENKPAASAEQLTDPQVAKVIGGAGLPVKVNSGLVPLSTNDNSSGSIYNVDPTPTEDITDPVKRKV